MTRGKHLKAYLSFGMRCVVKKRVNNVACNVYIYDLKYENDISLISMYVCLFYATALSVSKYNLKENIT